MNEKRRDYLIQLYESREGSRGRYSYLFEELRSLIEDLHNEGSTVFYIGDMIESEMDYVFVKKKYNVTDPFYRSLRLFITKNFGDRKKPKVIKKPESLPAKEKPVVKDRSSMTGEVKQTKPFSDHEPS